MMPAWEYPTHFFSANSRKAKTTVAFSSLCPDLHHSMKLLEVGLEASHLPSAQTFLQTAYLVKV